MISKTSKDYCFQIVVVSYIFCSRVSEAPVVKDTARETRRVDDDDDDDTVAYGVCVYLYILADNKSVVYVAQYTHYRTATSTGTVGVDGKHSQRSTIGVFWWCKYIGKLEYSWACPETAE